MVTARSGQRPPQRVAVVGAGMVGLATAWFLQERGCEVVVLDRTGVAAGASWGNAGWLTPTLTTPLPEPAILRYGLRAVISPASPVYVPLAADLQLARFLLGFVRNSTARRWGVGVRALQPLTRRALDAFDALEAGGVVTPTIDAKSFIACYRSVDERRAFVTELEHIAAVGQEVDYELLSGDEARDIEPALSDAVAAAIRIHGQRYLDPPAYVAALAESVKARGGELREGVTVRAIDDDGAGVTITASRQAPERFDAVVLATGAWLGALARRFGVRMVVQAGRGYSFSVPMERVPAGPVYLPTQRVACTPLGERLRVAGMMEFRRPEAPLDPRRIAAIIAATRP
ncbi:MAG TPA: FAD-dependent oxidoreductase, partial [Egibacteraceae bacterium]